MSADVRLAVQLREVEVVEDEREAERRRAQLERQSGVAGSTTRARKATPLAAIARTESFGAGMRPKALHADWP